MKFEPAMPAVSVIIPTYSHRDYVLETLDSVFAQTFTDCEVIVVNDGSPDDTAEVLRPLVEAGRIKYIDQPNAGQAAARNRGLAEARGEFIAFLDDDDIWPPDKLEWQVRVMRDSDHTAIGGVTGYIENGAYTYPKQDNVSATFDALSLIGNCPFQSPGQVLIRRAVLERIGGLDEAIWGADDFDLYIRLAMVGPISRVNRCALYYRRHANNASQALERMFWNCLAVIRKNVRNIPRASRRTAKRGAYRWLYHSLGRRVFDASLHGPSRNLGTAARITASLAVAATVDVSLAIAMTRTLLPHPVRNAFRSLCGRSI
jgi:glycosyltransferase involved in cell wall biosynthesis